MDRQAVRRFLEMQIDAAEKAEKEQESGLIFLMMADYCLETVQKQPEIFETMDMGQLRKAFLRCGSAAERIRVLYDTYHMPIQETSARVLNRMKQNIKQIEEKHQETVQLEEMLLKAEEKEQQILKENKELLSKQNELKKRREEYLSLSQTIEQCRKILREITPEILENMEKEKNTCEQEAKKQVERRDALLRETAEMQACLAAAQKQEEELLTQIAEKKEREQTLQKQIQKEEEQLKQLQERIAVFETEAEEMARNVSEAGEMYEELQASLRENEIVEKSILEDGYVDRESFYIKLDSVKQQADTLMDTYDQLLKNILADTQRLYEKIRERQKKKL